MAAMDCFKYFRPSKPTLLVLSAYTVSSQILRLQLQTRRQGKFPELLVGTIASHDSFQYVGHAYACVFRHTWKHAYFDMATYTMAALPIRESFLAYRISFGRFAKVFFAKFVFLDDSRKFPAIRQNTANVTIDNY